MRRSEKLLPLALLIPLVVSGSVAFAQPPPPPLTPLPPPPQPPGNPVTASKALLGKTLFWDEQLSSTRTVACGSCHQAKAGGSDPRSTLASAHAVNPGPDAVYGTADDITGSPGVILNTASGLFDGTGSYGLGVQVTGRHAPSHVNAAYAPLLFWDGRAGRAFLDPATGDTVLANGGALENQILGPPVSSTEMGHIGRSWTDVAARVVSSLPLALSAVLPPDLAGWINGRTYAQLFDEAFGSTEVTGTRIALAVASYERTLYSTRTPFDSLIAGTATLNPQENQGFLLFGQLGCAGCHAGSLMSDNRFHYIGVRPAGEDSGRAAVTHDPADLSAFRTPSLRNVALRTAFMHDGRFGTLADVIDFYDRGGDFNAPNKPPVIRPLGLNPGQKAALLAFLGRPLTDPRVAAASAPFDQPLLFSQSGLVPEVLSGGVAGLSGTPPEPVAIEPPLAGNPQFTVGVTGALGGASAVLVIDDAEPPVDSGIPATGSFARIETVLGGSGAAGGFGSVTLAIPDDPSLYGHSLYGRWYVNDPAASGGVASSPAFHMNVFGPNAAGVLATGPRLPAATSVHLYAIGPNPFRGTTALRITLPGVARTRLSVYDVSGRMVRRLYDRAAAPAGDYSLAWDGRDGAGALVPGGVYFYRLETDRGDASTRIVRLR